jgi:subtilisin family serine protease
MVGRPDKFSAMALENIAILDSGVDITHPALANRVWCTDNESKMDPSGHGTFVAGIIVGEEVFTDPNSATSDTINGMLPASKAWVCTVIDPSGIVLSGGNPTYFVDPGWYSWALNQIIFAREANISSKLGNIQVVNLSLGSSWYSYTEAQDIKRLIDSGCTVVAASGNRSGFIESAMYPSILPGVIAVGAYKYQQSNSLWEWTNWKGVNNSSYIIAPGEGIFSTIPITSNAMGINFSGWSTGTSFATPFVTAMAAAWLFSPPQNGSRLLEGIGVGASSTTWPTLKWNL